MEDKEEGLGFRVEDNILLIGGLNLLKRISSGLGAIAVLSNTFSVFVLKVPTLKRIPAPCTIMAGSTFLGCWMFAITAFFTVEGTWALSTGTDLIAAIYAVCLYMPFSFTNSSCNE